MGGGVDMGTQLAANWIAVVALALSALAVGYTWWSTRHTNRRDDRIEKSSAYLQLEVHSSEAFRYAAENSAAMKPFEASQRPSRRPRDDSKGAAITRQYYFQCLNLFEVCSNFRRNQVVDKHVYASWVAWFHEVLDQWYFRELWAGEMRENYTPDVRHIFDLGLQVYALHDDPEVRRREFYRVVSHLFGGCPIIEQWPEAVRKTPKWPPDDMSRVTLIDQEEARDGVA